MPCGRPIPACQSPTTQLWCSSRLQMGSLASACQSWRLLAVQQRFYLVCDIYPLLASSLLPNENHSQRILLLTGPSKLPSLGKELGKTVKSFQTAAKVYLGRLAQLPAAVHNPCSQACRSACLILIKILRAVGHAGV